MAKVHTNPVTRRQKFLGAIAGDNEAPTPITETEKLLNNIDEQVNGGGAGEQFIVTMTPTSETGGTMDKTNAEILEAYMRGQTIMFDIALDNISCRVQATLAATFEGYQYPSFNAYGIDTSGTTIINLYVNPSDEESYAFTMDTVDIGGGDTNTVTVTITKQSGTQYTLDIPASEIRTLINNGIKVLISDGMGVGAASDTGAYINAQITYVMPATPPVYNADVLISKSVVAHPDNTTATVSEKTYTLTASV